jgi:hypothetical protein
MNMKKSAVWGLGLFSVAALVAAACSPAPAGDDSGTGGEGASDTGGKGSGGKATGGNGSGGKATGGNGTGGVVADGGSDQGGTAGALPGGAGPGGQGGEVGTGGAQATAYCSGCLELFVPLAAEKTGTDFETDYGTGLVDVTGDTITARVHVVTNGNAGGIQVYAKNGEAQGYAGAYGPWNNLGDAKNGFVDISISPESVTDGFDATQVRWIGVTIQAGDSWDGAVWDDTTVYLDSISFANGSAPDITFGASAEGFKINNYNNPLVGSELTYLP